MMTSEPEGDVALPTGTVTFLLTDVSGSTRMWESEPHGPMREAILRHYEILGGAVAAHGGVRPQEQGEGDSVVAVFSRPSDALAAALQAQLMLQAEVWPTTARVQVRMAIHTGEAQLRDAANYAGQAIIRTARLRALGHGGQVLVSGATRDLVVDETAASFGFRPLGEHLLRDLGRREVVWQLTHPDLPSEFEPLSSPGPHRRSLPTPLTPFIGRAAELAELVGLVTTERLVLATGAGGAGKTRLAIEVGAMVGERFVGGVRWVELAALDAGRVESAVRAGFGISEAAEIPLEQSVARLIGEQPCLLIIDNCEHVAAGTASLVDRLLHAAPGLHVLATTRVVLGVPGEVAWRLPPLGLPAVGDTVTVGDLAGFDAIDLFCDRARRARPNFVLTDANAASVREICQRLDGIPLAIELAAARTRMMNPERMLAGLEDSFRLLAGGSQELMPRQQTIEASIAWSYDLLTPAEQRLLRRLAVFVDGWTLEAAEAICVDPIAGGEGAEQDLHEYAVFDALNRLVEHSLVQSEDTPLGIRFGILETVRQFGDRRLKSDSAEWSAAMERHARHHLEWACEVGPDLLSFVYAEHLPALVAERSNLLAACDWSLAHQSGDEVLRALLADHHGNWVAIARSVR